MYARFPDDPDGREGRLYYFAAPERFEGVATNAEPDKASEIGWFPVSELPRPFVPHMEVGIGAFLAGKTYAEFEGRFSDSQIPAA